MNFLLVRDVINHRCLYIDMNRIVSILIKPIVYIEGVKKEAPAAIVLDYKPDTNMLDSVIYIDETPEQLFKRISISCGCIKINLEKIYEMPKGDNNE